MSNVRNVFLVVISFLILYSSPFLFVPFDMLFHLGLIKSIMVHNDYTVILPRISFGRPFWHLMWASIFKFLNIHNELTIAKIIYKTQFLLTFFLIYFASGNFYRAISKLNSTNCNKNHEFVLGVCSALYFFIGVGVFSVNIQQSWILWYGINYQITLPICFYIMSLCVMYINYDRLELRITIMNIFKLVILVLLVMLFHAMELVYVFIFIGFIFAARIKEINPWAFFSYIVVILVSIIAMLFVPKLGAHFANISSRSIPFDLDRFYGSVSELNLACLFISVALINFVKIYFKNKVLLFSILIFCIFVTLIPVISVLRNIFGFVGSDIVWRYYLGSIWFIICPIVFYFFKNQNILKTMLFSSAILIVSLIVSLFNGHSVTYNNFKSICDTILARNVMNYSSANFKVVSDFMAHYDLSKTIFIARSDIAYMIMSNGGYTMFDYGNRKTKYVTNYESYNIVTVPNLFAINISAQKIWGWESSINDVSLH